jgi:hypothetical protein
MVFIGFPYFSGNHKGMAAQPPTGAIGAIPTATANAVFPRFTADDDFGGFSRARRPGEVQFGLRHSCYCLFRFHASYLTHLALGA